MCTFQRHGISNTCRAQKSAVPVADTVTSSETQTVVKDGCKRFKTSSFVVLCRKLRWPVHIMNFLTLQRVCFTQAQREFLYKFVCYQKMLSTIKVLDSIQFTVCIEQQRKLLIVVGFFGAFLCT